MIIASTRDQTICMLIVTNPETTAHASQNLALFAARLLAGVEINSSATFCPAIISSLLAFESIKNAATPITTFVAAAIQIVARTPKYGSRKNPAAMVPAIAPARLQAYSVVIEFLRD